MGDTIGGLFRPVGPSSSGGSLGVGRAQAEGALGAGAAQAAGITGVGQATAGGILGLRFSACSPLAQSGQFGAQGLLGAAGAAPQGVAGAGQAAAGGIYFRCGAGANVGLSWSTKYFNEWSLGSVQHLPTTADA